MIDEDAQRIKPSGRRRQNEAEKETEGEQNAETSANEVRRMRVERRSEVIWTRSHEVYILHVSSSEINTLTTK